MVIVMMQIKAVGNSSNAWCIFTMCCKEDWKCLLAVNNLFFLVMTKGLLG